MIESLKYTAELHFLEISVLLNKSNSISSGDSGNTCNHQQLPLSAEANVEVLVNVNSLIVLSCLITFPKSQKSQL